MVDPDIGVLFKWLDTLHCEKWLHPVTLEEIKKHKDPRVAKSFDIKLGNYHVLQALAPEHPLIHKVKPFDTTENDRNDTAILNELISDRTDFLITEDKAIIQKAGLLGVGDRVFTIDSFLERVAAEHPQLVKYKVLSVKSELFGNLNIKDAFFDSLRQNYLGFEKWFNGKSQETAYVCMRDGRLEAFLYLKLESESENYSDIVPIFKKKKRLKVGTFKVDLNGFKIGERFLKIIFDNALSMKVDEIYITLFNETLEQGRLVSLLEAYGFIHYGYKEMAGRRELVYVRDFSRTANRSTPKLTFPFCSVQGGIFIVSIYPEYHTSLLPDSILKTESQAKFEEDKPYRNAITKVYISRSHERNLHAGDLIVFYRTGGLFKGVVTTIGIVEGVITDIRDEEHFISLCGKRSVFTRAELSKHWNYNRHDRPFIVYFLYAYSFPKRINLKKLIGLKIVKDVTSAPRGFEKISKEQLKLILRETETDENLIVD